MNQILRLSLILLPVMIIVFFGKVLLFDGEKQVSSFDAKSFPVFQLNDLNGNLVQADALEGIKLLNVWASWCITCLVEHPFLTNLSENDIDIIGLNYKNKNTKAIAWLKKHGNPYELSIYDPRGDLAFELGVTGAPESFLIIDNQVVAHIQGELNQSKWDSIFLPIINAEKQRQ